MSAATDLVKELTLEEKVSLLSGESMWETRSVDRVGVPALRVTDGPNGARGTQFTEGVRAACFPCGAALAATWDPKLIEAVGAALGDEARTKGAHVLLGPTVNIHRSPLGGRNFECYSEDPLLSARIAAGFIRGVQSRGVAACVKHFVCNDSEFERHSISSNVGERALREIYLVPFEAAVTEGETWSLMSAYNKVNGTYASENPRLLTEILRDEWGFDGLVVSDWGGTYSTAPSVAAGMDLEMPGPGVRRGEALLAAVRSGEVGEDIIDERVRALLRVAERVGAFESPAGARPEEAIDRPEHRALARQAAGEGIVLLKNEGSLLPLDPEQLSSLAVIGPNADVAVIQGGGSAQVRAHYVVKPLEAIRKRCGDGVAVNYERGCVTHKTVPGLDPRHLTPADSDEPGGLLAEFFNSLDFSGEVVHSRHVRDARQFFVGAFAPGVDPRCYSLRLSGTFTPPENGRYVFGLISAGKSRLLIDDVELVDNWDPIRGQTFFGMGSSEVTGEIKLRADTPVAVRIELSLEGSPVGALKWGGERIESDDAMERAVAAAASADAAVLVVGLNGEWETEGNDRADMELPGRQVELIERVVAVNPRTAVVLNAGAPVSLDWAEHVPAVLDAWYLGQESGNAITDVLFGDRNPSGRLPLTFPKRLRDTPAFLNYPGENGEVTYGEGIFVGYRYYDAVDVEPAFPFGHGLSYTSFDYGPLSVEREGAEVVVSLDVTNSGERAGREVIQLYVHDCESSLARPEQELKAFAQAELEPGETETVRLRLGRRAFAFYDPAGPGWVAEPGDFELRAAASSRDIRSRASFRLEE